MINLLSPKDKEELLQEENWKIIIILGIIILAVFICFSLVLLSINIFISGEINSQKIIYQQKEEEFESPQMKNLEQGLITFNKTLYQLDSSYQNQLRTTKIFKELSEIIPLEIYLTNLSFNLKPADEKTLECTLLGFSPNRESLLRLKENLEKRLIFEEVYFPSASWIKSTDINFQVTFKVSPVRNSK